MNENRTTITNQLDSCAGMLFVHGLLTLKQRQEIHKKLLAKIGKKPKAKPTRTKGQ